MIMACSQIPETTESRPDIAVNRDLYPYQSRWLRLDNGTCIHYLDEGQGPTLLLLHGNPTWSFLYRHLIAELAEDFRLIAPDYPGFGWSVAPPDYRFTPGEHVAVMEEFVSKLDLTDVTLMMQDWGGPIGFALALRQSTRINAFVIGNTWAWPLERTGHKVFSTVMGGWPGQFAAWCCNGVVRLFMRLGIATKLTDAELAMYLKPFSDRHSRTPTHVFPAQLLAAKDFLATVSAGLGKLADRPALIVWGGKDFAFRKPERSRFESLFPHHQTVLLENAGHFIQEDAPAQIAVAIRNWHQVF